MHYRLSSICASATLSAEAIMSTRGDLNTGGGLRSRIAGKIGFYGRRATDRMPNRLKKLKFRTWVRMVEFTFVLLAFPATISYLLSGDERRKERQYQAWQVVALADG